MYNILYNPKRLLCSRCLGNLKIYFFFLLWAIFQSCYLNTFYNFQFEVVLTISSPSMFFRNPETKQKQMLVQPFLQPHQKPHQSSGKSASIHSFSLLLLSHVRSPRTHLHVQVLRQSSSSLSLPSSHSSRGAATFPSPQEGLAEQHRADTCLVSQSWEPEKPWHCGRLDPYQQFMGWSWDRGIGSTDLYSGVSSA